MRKTRRSLETLCLAIDQELRDLEWQICYPHEMVKGRRDYPLPAFFKSYDERIKELYKEAPDLEKKIDARNRLDKIKSRTDELFSDLLSYLENSAKENIDRTDRYIYEVNELIKKSETIEYEYQLYVFNMRMLYNKLAEMGNRELSKELESRVEKLYKLME